MNRRHGDFQSPALPTELPEQKMATSIGFEPTIFAVTGRHVNRYTTRPFYTLRATESPRTSEIISYLLDPWQIDLHKKTNICEKIIFRICSYSKHSILLHLCRNGTSFHQGLADSGGSDMGITGNKDIFQGSPVILRYF